MDIRTYPHDADSDVDAEQMTHFNLADELNARAAENERLRNELASIEEKFRVALGGYHDSNLLSLAESLRKFNEYHSDRIDDATEERDRLQDELDAERAQNKDMRKAIAKAIGIYVSDDKKTITIWDEDRLCINGGQTTEYYRHDNLAQVRAENERLRAENVRLDCELRLRIQQLMDTSRAVGQLLTANETLRDNAAELSKALDVCIAERDQAYRDLDAQTLKANSFRRELHRYMQHAIELKDMLDASVAENEKLRAELDAERNAHNATAAQLHAELADARAELDGQAKRHADVIDQWKAEENMWRYYDKKQLAQIDALRAELDAMRETHSVVAARMAAMGC